MDPIVKARVASFIVGASIASGVTSTVYGQHFLKEQRVILSALAIQERVSVLEALRAGKTDAAMVELEIYLSSSLASLDRDINEDVKGPTAEVLRRAAVYRKAHPARNMGTAEAETHVLAAGARVGAMPK